MMKKAIKSSLMATMLMGTYVWAAPVSLGVSRAWEAIQDKDASKCYIVSFASEKSGGDSTRNPYLTVTINKNSGINGQFAYAASYNFAQGKPLTATVNSSSGNKSFQLVSQDGWAWAGNDQEDNALLSAMIKGRSVDIKGTDTQGQQIKDTFSLSGVTASWNKAKTACGN